MLYIQGLFVGRSEEFHVTVKSKARFVWKPEWSPLSHVELSYCASLCHHTIVCHLILNAWLLIGCYEISPKLQLSSMSFDALNVLLLGQAVLTIVPQSSSVASGSPTVRRPKSRDLKPANPSPWCHLSCDIPLFPIHTRSKAAERMEPWGHGIKVWFLLGLSNIRLAKQCNRWIVESAEELTWTNWTWA